MSWFFDAGFSGVHLWTADARANWLSKLDAMAARETRRGVSLATWRRGARDRLSAIRYNARLSVGLRRRTGQGDRQRAPIDAMTERYPDCGHGRALQISAKVAKGAMKWVDGGGHVVDSGRGAREHVID